MGGLLGHRRSGAREAWTRALDPAKRRPPLLFHRVPEPKVVKNRLHLDLFVGRRDAPDHTRLVDAEAERLVGLGAIHVRTETEEDDHYAVLQDPEGNELCIC